MPASEARFELEDRDGCRTLVVSGEIDISTAPTFSRELETLIGEAHSPAVLDLSAVTFIDASGLSVLVGAHRKVENTDVAIMLLNPSEFCRRILEITGLAAVFEARTNNSMASGR